MVITMTFPSKETVQQVKNNYPAGTKVKLVKMDDPCAPPIGTKGEVISVDDCATIHVKWENGSSLGVVYGEDKCVKT